MKPRVLGPVKRPAFPPARLSRRVPSVQGSAQLSPQWVPLLQGSAQLSPRWVLSARGTAPEFPQQDSRSASPRESPSVSGRA